MKTLVYFASGQYKHDYQDLPFDRIYLVDNCHKPPSRKQWIESIGKVVCLGMDCLKSIEYLKSQKVRIDYFVSLNEGLYEGGGGYAINSDMFLGYVMPLLNEEYYHLMNPSYYNGGYKVSMDLPYIKEEIAIDDQNYLEHSIFSDAPYNKGNVKIYRMIKNRTEINLLLKNGLALSVIHDSIWNDYPVLDLAVLSIESQGQEKYFNTIPKVIDAYNNSLEEILKLCETNKYLTIGFTPWMKGDYDSVLELLNQHKGDFLKEIRLYHLNAKDYKTIKN